MTADGSLERGSCELRGRLCRYGLRPGRDGEGTQYRLVQESGWVAQLNHMRVKDRLFLLIRGEGSDRAYVDHARGPSRWNRRGSNTERRRRRAILRHTEVA